MKKIMSVSFKSGDDGNVYVSTDDDPKFYHNDIGNDVKVELLSCKNGICYLRNLETKKLCNISKVAFEKYFQTVENSNNIGDDQIIVNSGSALLICWGICA